jgi:hypothetical protein
VSLCEWSGCPRRLLVFVLAVLLSLGGFLTCFVSVLLTFSPLSKSDVRLLGDSLHFPVSSLCSLLFFHSLVAFREFILVNLDSLSSSFRSFFVGVSRFAENGLGPPPIEGFVSPDSVLH